MASQVIQILYKFSQMLKPQKGVPKWGSQKGGVLDPPPKRGSGLLSILRFSGGTPPPFHQSLFPLIPLWVVHRHFGVSRKWPKMAIFDPPPKTPFFDPFLGVPKKRPFFQVFFKNRLSNFRSFALKICPVIFSKFRFRVSIVTLI